MHINRFPNWVYSPKCACVYFYWEYSTKQLELKTKQTFTKKIILALYFTEAMFQFTKQSTLSIFVFFPFCLVKN